VDVSGTIIVDADALQTTAENYKFALDLELLAGDAAKLTAAGQPAQDVSAGEAEVKERIAEVEEGLAFPTNATSPVVCPCSTTAAASAATPSPFTAAGGDIGGLCCCCRGGCRPCQGKSEPFLEWISGDFFGRKANEDCMSNARQKWLGGFGILWKCFPYIVFLLAYACWTLIGCGEGAAQFRPRPASFGVQASAVKMKKPGVEKEPRARIVANHDTDRKKVFVQHAERHEGKELRMQPQPFKMVKASAKGEEKADPFAGGQPGNVVNYSIYVHRKDWENSAVDNNDGTGCPLNVSMSTSREKRRRREREAESLS